MTRLIPGKTSVKLRLFKNISLLDMLIAAIGVSLVTLICLTPFSFRFWVAGGIAVIFIALLFRLDSEPAYVFVFRMLRHMVSAKRFSKEKSSDAKMEDLIAFTGIKDNFIEYDGKYYGAVIEIPPVEFRFFSDRRRRNSIENGIGSILRSTHTGLGVNIVKIERPITYDHYLDREYARLEEMKKSFENGLMTEEELKIRSEVVYDRINELNDMMENSKVVDPFYYICLFDADKRQLQQQISVAMTNLTQGEMQPRRLNSKELAVFLRYSNELDFNEADFDDIEEKDYAKMAMPEHIVFRTRNAKIDKMVTHHFKISGLPSSVTDAWMAGVMSIPSTKVTVKCTPTDQLKTIRSIDNSIQELQSQYSSTGVASKQLELQTHIESLARLLVTLQEQNETLMDVNVYISVYDRALSETQDPTFKGVSQRRMISNMKQTVRRIYRESNMKLSVLEGDQLRGFIGAQISGYDPMKKDGFNIPTNTIAAMFPWIYAHIEDEKGLKYGSSEGIPVMLDFFERNSLRVNSNMVIVGKSGSGKSFATKSILTNLATEDSKIFVLDPENEYTELAGNLHGKFINVGNASQGRLNPFHIMTELEDDEDDATTVSSSYSMHLQFLEEFYRQILPDCDKDALEYLNLLTDRMYTNKGITQETNLSKLRPSDYPVFDDLYDEILKEFQTSDNEYIRTMLRTLVNYISKFSTGGRNAAIWNGESTIETDENFTVFNFQSLLSNRNQSIANAQMLLVLKYIDHEIIRNREYNLRKNRNRKVIVVIDEAHVFIDEKYPVALDFMFQLAKRIRKYNGMQIVITQNIKDFVGSEELARKSAAIINACQYSLIFSLAPNDMEDLCLLYEKAGGINKQEQEEIVSAPRGEAFLILGPSSRTTFHVDASDLVRDVFENPTYETRYFESEEDENSWDEYISKSRVLHEEGLKINKEIDTEVGNTKDQDGEKSRSHITIIETTDEEYEEDVPPVDVEEMTDEELDQMINALHEKEEEAFHPVQISSPEEAILPSGNASPVQVTVKPEGFDDMMDKLTTLVNSMTQFNYEAMRAEMQRMIQESMSGNVSSRPAVTPVPVPVPVTSPSEVSEETEEYTEEPETNESEESAEDISDIDDFDSLDENEEQNQTETEEDDDDDTSFEEFLRMLSEHPSSNDEEDTDDETDETEDEDEESETDVNDIFGAYSDSDDEDLDTDDSDDDDDDDDDEEDSDDSDAPVFDIMKLLRSQADEMEKRSVIDDFMENEEETMDVSLDDLIKFMNNQNS